MVLYSKSVKLRRFEEGSSPIARPKMYNETPSSITSSVTTPKSSLAASSMPEKILIANDTMKFISPMTTPIMHLIAGLKFLGLAGSIPSFQLSTLDAEPEETELPDSTSFASASSSYTITDGLFWSALLFTLTLGVMTDSQALLTLSFWRR